MPPQSTMRPLSQITALTLCERKNGNPVPKGNIPSKHNYQGQFAKSHMEQSAIALPGEKKKKFINNNFFQKKKNGPTRCPIHSMSDYPPPPHLTGKSLPLLHAKRRYYQLDPADLDGDEMRKGEM